MTKSPTSNNYPPRSYKDLPDMSTAGRPGRMVAVNVRDMAFQIHLGKLGPLTKHIHTHSNGSMSISLPNDNPIAFNTVVNWMYNGFLPRAAKASEYANRNDTPVPAPSPPRAGLKSLVDMALGNGNPSGSSGKSAPNNKAPNAGEQTNTPLKDAHVTQCILLEIMMMAERWRWEQLYNAAIDAFREGEQNLARKQPDVRHLEVVYQQTSWDSPIRIFMGDYVYYLARANKNLSSYLQQNCFERMPGFLDDMLKRVDGRGPYQYPMQRQTRGDGDGSKESGRNKGAQILHHEVPLDLAATTYHVHNGRLTLDCRRSRLGSCDFT